MDAQPLRGVDDLVGPLWIKVLVDDLLHFSGADFHPIEDSVAAAACHEFEQFLVHAVGAALHDQVNFSPDAIMASQNAATRRRSMVNMSCTNSKFRMPYSAAICRMSRSTRSGERSRNLRRKKSLVEQKVQA